MSRGLTYAGAGVDIDARGRFVETLIRQFRSSRRKNIGIGHFAGAVHFGNSLLTLACDGVGSKIMIARAMGRWETVGIDCVAMNVNDTVCIGARPVALVDYIALPSVDLSAAAPIGKGLNAGAMESGAPIVGGEVAVLPDMVKEMDISATCLGIVPAGRAVTGQRIREGDAIIGLPSSGVHSNGFTLIRRILESSNISLDEPFGRGKLGTELLKPTSIYVKEIMRLLRKTTVHGIAHITGGGFRNIVRLKKTVKFTIESLPRVPAIFDFISKEGKVEDREMFQTFNMGTGMVIVVPQHEADAALSLLKGRRRAYLLGHVERGRGVHIQEYGLQYTSY